MGIIEFQILASLIILTTPFFGAHAPFYKIFGISVNTIVASAIGVL